MFGGVHRANAVDVESFPACFTELKFYRNWKAKMPSCPDKDHATICSDCLPGYQIRMKRLGRCSNPEAAILFDEDGNVVGMGTR